MIVRWGLRELPDVLAHLGVERPLLVAGRRWGSLQLPVEPAARWAHRSAFRAGKDASRKARAATKTDASNGSCLEGGASAECMGDATGERGAVEPPA